MQIDNNSEVKMIMDFNLEDTPRGKRKHYWLKIISDGFSNPICIPLMVMRGFKDGPILGVTAAVHGNELNGISVIQRLFNEVSVEELSGTIVGVPVVNVPAFERKKRRFNDGVDINHIMPGIENGNVSQVYAYRFVNRFIKHIDYLLDLHTASTGRINSYYIRADMDDPKVKRMAKLQNADIIVHNPPLDGTLRGAADDLGIPAITLEVGNPSTFQKKLIRSGIDGIQNVMCDLGMIQDEIISTERQTVECKKSQWIYTDSGGLLTIPVEIRQMVKKGELIAVLRDIFGNKMNEYFSPHDGIVIGKSVSPVNQSGGRILHLGILK
ncbi:MAG: succinylglutamate desuccinylase/aspartoacylase family protein [Saprospiraceae bacterium]|nr:succinylglutamate desuccinylase/aspartoacylase family protein [Saprospiraceae bacterium]